MLHLACGSVTVIGTLICHTEWLDPLWKLEISASKTKSNKRASNKPNTQMCIDLNVMHLHVFVCMCTPHAPSACLCSCSDEKTSEHKGV